MNKYEFVPGDEITIAPGRTAKRIRALVTIAAYEARLLAGVGEPDDLEALRDRIMEAMRPLVNDHDSWRDWPGTYLFANAAINAMLITLASHREALAAAVLSRNVKLVAMTKWLEENQPDVFKRGIWDALTGTAQS